MILFQLLVSMFISRCINGEVIENNDYMGEKFPDKYLLPEKYKPILANIDMLIDALSKTVYYYASDVNFTEVNKGLGMFFTQAILKRTLIDEGYKLPKDQRNRISNIIKQANYVVSHFVYDTVYGTNPQSSAAMRRVAQFFKEPDLLAHSLPRFNKGRLTKWIKSKGNLNEYIKEIDEATLPKEKYVELVDDSYITYFIKVEDSDRCLSRLIYNVEPDSKNTVLRPCRKDPKCHQALHASPSISYGLSHRMLNMFLYRNLRHCYWVSPHADELHIDILCAFMYRETVYLARRGYFARDLFLEHISLCAMMGYEEFFRQHWFRKAMSWMDEDGCIQEDRNFEINRTARFLKNIMENRYESKLLRKSLKERLLDDCHNHPMALLSCVLSNGIRHAAHFLST